MNIFDKICASVAFILGVVFILLGVIGLFTGCKAHFILPPVVGVIPAFVGWGIVRPIMVAWRGPRRPNILGRGTSISTRVQESWGEDASGDRES